MRLKTMNNIKSNRGKGSGLMLIIILVVAVVIAFLVVRQMGGLGAGSKQQQEQTRENAVEQARDAVDAINERMKVAGQEP